MARAQKRSSILSILTVAAGAVPPLPTALAVMAPIAVAQASTPDQAALPTLAQAIARGDMQIGPKQVQDMLLAQRHDFTLVDIRRPQAFAAGHIRDARNIPLARLGTPKEINILRRSPQVILYADTTEQAAEAAVMLRGAGVMARALTGGLAAWGKTIEAAAAKPDQVAIVRALNLCPEPTEATIPPLGAPAEAVPATPPATRATQPATPPAKSAPVPINLNGMCG